MSKSVKVVDLDELLCVCENQMQVDVVTQLAGKVLALRQEAQKQRSAGQREKTKAAVEYYKAHGPGKSVLE